MSAAIDRFNARPTMTTNIAAAPKVLIAHIVVALRGASASQAIVNGMLTRRRVPMKFRFAKKPTAPLLVIRYRCQSGPLVTCSAPSMTPANAPASTAAAQSIVAGGLSRTYAIRIASGGRHHVRLSTVEYGASETGSQGNGPPSRS